MNKSIRILLAFVVFAAIVAIGINGSAWADKLNIASQAPAASGPSREGSAQPRQDGTVPATNYVIPVTGGSGPLVVGSCATVSIDSEPPNVAYTASVVPANTLAQVLPGKVVSCGIKIEAKPSSNLGAEAQVCFPIPPSQADFAYYYDGTQWVKTTLGAQEGQSCVNVPKTAGNPAFAALFDK